MKTMLVHDMSCQHCVDRINKILEENNIEANVDLAKREVSISNDSDIHKTVELLSDLGYEAALK